MNPYHALLRTNRNYRLLFIGQTVSQLGDWFSAIAVYALLLDLTGSATSVAWMMIAQFLPFAIVGPVAGVVVDRVNRRTLMIVADLLRGVVVLGLLLIRRPDQVWIAYAVTAVMVVGLERSSSRPGQPPFPNITSAEELLPANALSSALWSGMLAIGASVGGLATVVAGPQVAFLLNAVSFFVSAIFIARTRYDATPPLVARPQGLMALTGLSDLVEGFGYVRKHAHVAALMFVKCGWGLAGGVLLLLTVFGQRVFPVARQHRRGHRLSLRRARHRRRPRSNHAAVDAWANAGRAPPHAGSGVFHGRRVLHGRSPLRRRCGSRRSRSSARISEARFSGSSAPCCCSSKCPIDSAGVCSPPSWRW